MTIRPWGRIGRRVASVLVLAITSWSCAISVGAQQTQIQRGEYLRGPATAFPAIQPAAVNLMAEGCGSTRCSATCSRRTSHLIRKRALAAGRPPTSMR